MNRTVHICPSPSCGKEAPERAGFCPFCGTKLPETTLPGGVRLHDSMLRSEEIVIGNKIVYQTASRKDAQPGFGMLAIGIITIIAVAGLAVIAAMIFAARGSTQAVASAPQSASVRTPQSVPPQTAQPELPPPNRPANSASDGNAAANASSALDRAVEQMQAKKGRPVSLVQLGIKGGFADGNFQPGSPNCRVAVTIRKAGETLVKAASSSIGLKGYPWDGNRPRSVKIGRIPGADDTRNVYMTGHLSSDSESSAIGKPRSFMKGIDEAILEIEGVSPGIWAIDGWLEGRITREGEEGSSYYFSVPIPKTRLDGNTLRLTIPPDCTETLSD